MKWRLTTARQQRGAEHITASSKLDQSTTGARQSIWLTNVIATLAIHIPIDMVMALIHLMRY